MMNRVTVALAIVLDTVLNVWVVRIITIVVATMIEAEMEVIIVIKVFCVFHCSLLDTMSEADSSADWRVKKPANPVNSASEEVNRENSPQNMGYRHGGSNYGHGSGSKYRYRPHAYDDDMGFNRDRDHYRDDESPRDYYSRPGGRSKYIPRARKQDSPSKPDSDKESRDPVNLNPPYSLSLLFAHP